jgi:apoptosis-inducing factor 2
VTGREADGVVIYGGGIAGGVLAKKLSRNARVTLVDPLDYFEVPMAVPRNLVMPAFAKAGIIPFAEAMPKVEHLRARLVELSPRGGLVENAEGQQMLVQGAVTVLSTGSRFPNELVRAHRGERKEREAFYQRFHERLSSAQRILIVGGGPIGVEVAGEITETWPEKSVTIVEAGPRLLGGTSAPVAAHAASFLTQRGVSILTGERVEGVDDAETNVFADGGEARTSAGRSIPYDLAFWCIGGRPNTAYMQRHFPDTLTSDGRIKVGPDLRVAGQERIFALGDITDLPENKMAFHIKGQVKIAESNVRALLDGKAAPLTYKPQTGNPTMVVTLGSRAGVAHLPLFGVVRWPWLIRKAKAEQMLVPMYRKALGY